MEEDRTAYTLENTIEFVSRKYMGQGDTKLVIKPGSDGLNITTPLGRFPIDSDHTHAYKRTWAHLLVITQDQVYKARLKNMVAMVPEHVMAAIHLLNITDAEMEICDTILRENERLPVELPFTWWIPRRWKAVSFPVCGCTSKEFYDQLKENRKVITGKKIPVYQVVHRFSYPFRRPKIEVEPAGTFEVIVKGMPNDKLGYSPKTVKIKNVYEQTQEYIDARGLNRPPRIKAFLRYGKWFVGHDNYPTLHPRQQKTLDQKRDAMQTQYRNGMNEQLHHTIQDLLGESGILLKGHIKGRFILHDLGQGHSTRLSCLKRMIQYEIIQKYE